MCASPEVSIKIAHRTAQTVTLFCLACHHMNNLYYSKSENHSNIVCYALQGCPILVLEGRCTACFRCFPAPAHLIQLNGYYPASIELDNNPFI